MAYTFKHGDRPLDDYTIQRAVGGGGFGEVYYAISDGGREVALKYLKSNPQVELRGVSHCINLKSPHLVSIFDVKKNADGEYFIIMEYCSGPSLRDLLIAEPNGFGPQKAAFFLREIGKGLAYLHDRGIVHRDLKPGNIFYDDGYVKIGDYGLSKFIAVSRHSMQTASVGTVHYMAPEIGSGDYSRGVDIYALGVVLYEMLLGRVPFEGSTMAEVLMKHLTTQPEVDRLPQPFGAVIRKAMAKDPRDRYQTVDEMIDELLAVDSVKESLAGFSTQSLAGAVRRGGRDALDSPMPSPNPPPIVGGGFELRPPLPRPGPHDVDLGRSPLPLPDRLQKRLDRRSRKLDQKMVKLARQAGIEPPTPRGQRPHWTPAAPRGRSERGKRIGLTILLLLGMAIGLGVVVGNTVGENHGFAAALMSVGMSGGLLFSRGAARWFGADCGPKWTGRIIRACCCAPLLALGGIPLFDSRADAGTGFGVWLGLLCVSIFANWEKAAENATTHEMSFGAALWTGFGALVATAIAAAYVGDGPDGVMLLSAGAAAIASLVVQASAWWTTPPLASAAEGDGAVGTPPQAAQVGSAGRAVVPPPLPFAKVVFGVGVQPASAAPTAARERWGVTRAFWGFVALLLMGGAIVTFMVIFMLKNLHPDEVSGCIVGCIACGSMMIFALRKTTPLRRPGFWHETMRPFLFAASMIGVGGTITAIARYWHCDYMRDDDRVMCIVGLVFSSLLFLATLFPLRVRPKAGAPFLRNDSGAPATNDSGPAAPEAAGAVAARAEGG
ncbi:MAG: serine/threonine protein kinase [Planctomycetes bacterium]|nr:serine/threonine protein kinase [Planctomycetota bacterium]